MASVDEARRRFQSLLEARDAEALQDVLDDDFTLLIGHPVAQTMPRPRWFEVLSDYHIHRYEVIDDVVDVDGEPDTAELAVAYTKAHMQATVLGQDRSGIFMVTDVWRRRGDGWRLWRRHSTPLDAGPISEAGHA